MIRLLSYVHNDTTIPSQYLHLQSQQWKHQNNVSNLFKVNRKAALLTGEGGIEILFFNHYLQPTNHIVIKY